MTDIQAIAEEVATRFAWRPRWQDLGRQDWINLQTGDTIRHEDIPVEFAAEFATKAARKATALAEIDPANDTALTELGVMTVKKAVTEALNEWVDGFAPRRPPVEREAASEAPAEMGEDWWRVTVQGAKYGRKLISRRPGVASTPPVKEATGTDGRRIPSDELWGMSWLYQAEYGDDRFWAMPHLNKVRRVATHIADEQQRIESVQLPRENGTRRTATVGHLDEDYMQADINGDRDEHREIADRRPLGDHTLHLRDQMEAEWLSSIESTIDPDRVSRIKDRAGKWAKAQPPR